MLQNRKTGKMVFRNYRKFADVIKVQVVFALQDMGICFEMSLFIRLLNMERDTILKPQY